MMNPTYPPGGDGGGSAPAPGGGRYRRRYLGTQTIAASGTWSKAAALALPMLAGLAEADIEVDIECIGGGASGWHGLVRGGAPGAVVRRTRALADLPATVPVSVGAGGAVPPSAMYSGYSYGGGDTAFGDYARAGGGLGSSNNFNGAVDLLLPASDVPLACPRQVQSPPYRTTELPADSLGPGAGGAGTINANSSMETNGTAGGASGAATTATRLAGGAMGQPGRDAVNEWQYGSGGGGAGRYAVAGRGGFPGGGGGGGRVIGEYYGAWDGAGPGGAGFIRLPYYVWEPL